MKIYKLIPTPNSPTSDFFAKNEWGKMKKNKEKLLFIEVVLKTGQSQQYPVAHNLQLGSRQCKQTLLTL
jgi:hypothetical protein